MTVSLLLFTGLTGLTGMIPAASANGEDCGEITVDLPLLDGAVAVPSGQVAVDTVERIQERIESIIDGGSDETDDEVCNASRVGCWEWNKNSVSSDSCRKDRNKDFTNFGTYYCGPVQNQGVGCQNHGSPTSGTVDVKVEWGTETAAFWCRSYDGGVGVDQCQGTKDRAIGARVLAGSLFGQSIEGTYGGWYQ